MALHNRILTADLLEGRARDCVVAILPWRDVQFDAALIKEYVKQLLLHACGLL